MKSREIKEIIKNLEVIGEGISNIITVLKESDNENVENVVELVPDTASPVEEETTEEVAEEVVPEKEDTPEVEPVSVEELENMPYNALRKLAKSLGLSSAGARDVLIERIIEACGVDESTEETAEEPVETVEEVTEEPVEETAEEESSDDITALITETVADWDNTEIADFLTELGYKPKGKRQALIAMLVEAYENGDVDLGEEEDEETEKSVEEPAEDSEFEVTEERAKALEDFRNETTKDFENGEFDEEAMKEWIEEYYSVIKEKCDFKDMSSEDILDMYITLASNLISDEGEFIEEEGTPYYVNGEAFCCGYPLKHVSNNKNDEYHICECCGTQYEY